MDKKVKSVCLIFILFITRISFVLPEEQVIRFPVWVALEAYPGLQDSSVGGTISGLMNQAVSEVKKLAEFMAQGMIYGWDFSYVPSDNARQVREFFSLSSSIPDNYVKIPLRYTDIRLEESRLTCWAEFIPTADIITRQKQWTSVLYPKIAGKGTGDVSKGIQGVYDAYSAAVNNAVREYVRTIRKNKPKEINGSVVLTELPRIYIERGKYVVDAKFFLVLKEIIPYTVF